MKRWFSSNNGLLLLLSTMFSASCNATDTKHVVVYPKYSQRSEFYAQVLNLALQKTANEYGSFELHPFEREVSTERLRRYLKLNQHIDVLWSSSNKQRDRQLRAVRFDLLKGLSQYRFLLIKKGQHTRFSTINKLEDLRYFTAGSGTYWSDTQILKYNGIPTISSVNDSLLPMLAAGRFDYVSRGSYEVWSELNAYKGQFDILKHVVLHYPTRYFFYVNPDNTLLAERLEKGLYMALADGSFDQLFFSVADFQQGWDKLIELENSTTISLQVP
ncbi:transporter substrate-binding domain-containing protein [Agarivorans sp. TSD2052]|uniref:transporter substrate-binding domain-containing protein n=1 Tax=Agarivorans sp. TSD2052 TaxID=2937286 RepID=UPI00200C11B0|nr:transporter substrate-binding domain-containing protein [Agarivorans sp. TSD2052]UPW19548.1 transporter substrate-binding domain-containing protein [Agarivorans sp. TSD2052]